jgi:hypothetical protein
MIKWIPIPPDRVHVADRAARRAIRYAVVLWIASIVFFYLPTPFVIITLPLAAGGFTFAILFLRRAHFRELGLRKTFSPALPYPLSLHYQIATGALIFAGMVLLHQTIFTIASPHTWMLPYLSIIAPIGAIGAGMLVAGYFAREPTSLSCPDCFYSVESLKLPLACPECGRSIASADMAVGTIRARRPIVGNAGAVLSVFAFIAWFVLVLRPSHVMNWLPTSNRIPMATSDPRAFHSLIKQNLTPQQTATLIDAILDAQDAGATNLSAQLDWIDTLLAAGSLTDTQTIRLLFGNQEFTIAAEGRPTVGRPITLRLNTTDAFRARSMRVRSTYFFSGFQTDPALDTQQPPTNAAWLPIGDLRPPSPRPAAVITPLVPGQLHVRGRVVLAATPLTPAPPSITWHDDATYTITPEPLTTHEITAEITLEIAP